VTTFIDTSFFIALLTKEDRFHAKADQAWRSLLESDDSMVSTNYTLLETFSLIQNRLGLEAVADFQRDVVPLLSLEWVDENCHEAGLAAVLTAKRRNLSLVDCVSFEIMRRNGLKNVLTFDKHFGEHGFYCLP
jgi:predicted nucleic acid-binding protein